MPRLNELHRGQAIGILQAGNTQEEVAFMFGVTKRAIQRLWRRLNSSWSVFNAPRSGRLRVTMPRDDRYMRRMHEQNCFQTAILTAAILGILTHRQF